MTLNGRFSQLKYCTSLEEAEYRYEITSGDLKGSIGTGDYSDVVATPDFVRETTDIRFFGWVLLILYIGMSGAVIVKNERWDVAGIVFTPFFLLPAVLILRFGRANYNNLVFRYRSGQPAFAIPEKDWESEDITNFLRDKLGEQAVPPKSSCAGG